MEETTPAPSREEPTATWEHFSVFVDTRKTISVLPSYFKSDLVVDGVLATDLFAFNSSLGATIEAQVVDALNSLRSSWDPDQRYTTYRFVRQSQTFPDVTLRASSPDQLPRVILGIELKGWYVLAKEREPSFCYRVTPNVCAPGDLLVVVPWALSNVISGSPILFPPFIELARYAAEYRNFHWVHLKGGSDNNAIGRSTVDHFYPTKAERIGDVPRSDAGGNFGRFARTGLMDEYIAALFQEELAGIPLDAWQRFLSLFGQERNEDRIYRELDRLAQESIKGRPALTPATVAGIRARLAEIVDFLEAP